MPLKQVYCKNCKNDAKNKVFIIKTHSPKFTTNRNGWGENRDHENRTIESLLQEFIETTTIPGICQLAGNKGKINKILWVMLFLTGIGMAIYQSGNLIVEYTKYAVMERSVRNIEWTTKFPSATVCVNTPMRWKPYENNPGKRLVDKVNERLRQMNASRSLYQQNSDRQTLLLEELSALNSTERMMIGYDKKMFVIICEWGDVDCKKDLYPSNNLFFGNCITYNPGFNESNVKYAAKSESLFITVRSNFEDEFPYLLRDNGPILLIHPAGTAPVLDKRLIYNLFPGRWLRLGISKRIFQRLPAPYSSMCISENNDDFQKKSVYYSKDTPYLYSIEACTQSCTQMIAINTCGCLASAYDAPALPDLKICENRRCDALDGVDINQQCDCRKPCEETMYDVRVDIDDRWLEQQVWQDWVSQGVNQYNNVSLNLSEVSGFEIYTSNTMVEKIKEEPKISWADFLGSIGGNLGLWVGISIISIVEIIEIFGRIVVLKIKQIANLFNS